LLGSRRGSGRRRRGDERILGSLGRLLGRRVGPRHADLGGRRDHGPHGGVGAVQGLFVLRRRVSLFPFGGCTVGHGRRTFLTGSLPSVSASNGRWFSERGYSEEK